MESAAFVFCCSVRHIIFPVLHLWLGGNPPCSALWDSLWLQTLFGAFVISYWQTLTEEEQGKKAKPLLLSGKECSLKRWRWMHFPGTSFEWLKSSSSALEKRMNTDSHCWHRWHLGTFAVESLWSGEINSWSGIAQLCVSSVVWAGKWLEPVCGCGTWKVLW